MNGYFWQLVFVDLLFLGLAAALGFWFRSWLRRAGEDFDRRLQVLEAHRMRLERLAERLQGICGPEPRISSGATGPVSKPPDGSAPLGRPRDLEERYSQAWRMVDQGLPAAEVARRLELGLAEVELMARIQRYKSRS